jgi:hypothetical protein
MVGAGVQAKPAAPGTGVRVAAYLWHAAVSARCLSHFYCKIKKGTGTGARTGC